MNDFSWVELNNIKGLDRSSLLKISYALDIKKFKNLSRLELVKEILSLQDEKNKILYYDEIVGLLRKNEKLNVWKYYEKGGGIL